MISPLAVAAFWVQFEGAVFHGALHAQFKRANGYSELEIAQKRSALENVLLRESLEKYHLYLSSAGFTRNYTWFQCFNFVSLVAFRD